MVFTVIALLAVIFAFMGNVSAASGDVIYVNGNSTLGNDAWNGESPTYVSGIIGPKYSIKNATGTVNNNGQIYLANGQYTGSNNQQITITKNMTINGESQKNTIINGTGVNEQVFYIQSGVNVIINNLTITNAYSYQGGAIYNHGTVTINNSTISNSRGQYGSAIWNDGNLTVNNTILINNTAAYGGAIYNLGNSTVTGSDLLNNLAEYGGAIYSN